MKTVPLSVARSKLRRYGEICRREPVVVTVKGKPAFELVPFEPEAFMSDLIETNAEFREVLVKRRHDKTFSTEETLRRIR
jgi:antitoxin (DNA-binding transcriptional repressor) of toxin-antitoxin stability system